MNTHEKLERLRELAIDFYTKQLEDGSMHPRDMASIVSLLSTNSVTLEKGKSTIEEEIQDRVKKAKERRNERT